MRADGMNYSVIAEALDMKEVTVKSTVSATRYTLRIDYDEIEAAVRELTMFAVQQASEQTKTE